MTRGCTMRELFATAFLFLGLCSGTFAEEDVDRLVAAMLGDTPIIADLRQLTDEIGGRVTGTASNLAAVEWGLAKFTEAGGTRRR